MYSCRGFQAGQVRLQHVPFIYGIRLLATRSQEKWNAASLKNIHYYYLLRYSQERASQSLDAISLIYSIASALRNPRGPPRGRGSPSGPALRAWAERYLMARSTREGRGIWPYLTVSTYLFPPNFKFSRFVFASLAKQLLVCASQNKYLKNYAKFRQVTVSSKLSIKVANNLMKNYWIYVFFNSQKIQNVNGCLLQCWCLGRAKVRKSCWSRPANEYLLAKSTSIEPRTSRSKFAYIHLPPGHKYLMGNTELTSSTFSLSWKTKKS